MRRALLAILAAAWMAPAALASVPRDPIQVVPQTCLAIVPFGGASGGDALYCNGGDLIGWRNLQGGGPGGIPFDIGAGSTADPSPLVLQWDIGDGTFIYDGLRHLMFSVTRDGTRIWWNRRVIAWFGPRGTVFYGPVRFARHHARS